MPKRTVWMKWVLPYVIILLVFAWAFCDERPDYASAALVFIAMVVIMFFVSKRHNKHMPDQVLDGGTFLQVTFGRATERIPLSNVASMDAHKIIRVSCCVFGSCKLRRYDHLRSFPGSRSFRSQCRRRQPSAPDLGCECLETCPTMPCKRRAKTHARDGGRWASEMKAE
jgi:hypothetical protein